MKAIQSIFTRVKGAYLSASLFLFSGLSLATTLDDWKDTAGDRMQTIKEIIEMIGWVGGTGLVLLGLFLLYKNSQQPGQDHAKKGIIALLVGGALFALPTIVDIATDTATGESGEANMKKSDNSF